MTLITKEYFSSSIAGRGINIVATTSLGSLIHKTTANAFDEVWLWASNPGPASVNLVIEFGGTSVSDLIELDIPNNSGLMLVVPGVGLSAGQSLRAYADTSNAICLFGYVNRISEAQQSPETPTSPSWIRPAEWLELPTVSPGDEKLVGLYRVNPDSNFFTFTGEGAYTIDFGDGSAPINYGSGTTAYKILDWDDYSGSTLTSDGFRQAVITITPQSGQHITSIDLSKTHNQPGLSDTYNNGWLDIDLSGEFIDNIILNSDLASLYHFGSLTRFNFIGVNAITDFSGMFAGCLSLSAIPTLDTSNGTDFSSMFTNCSSLSAIQSINPTQDWSVEGCLFSADALNIIYTALPVATATLTITGNWGAAASNTSIATAKGWTITN